MINLNLNKKIKQVALLASAFVLPTIIFADTVQLQNGVTIGNPSGGTPDVSGLILSPNNNGQTPVNVQPVTGTNAPTQPVLSGNLNFGNYTGDLTGSFYSQQIFGQTMDAFDASTKLNEQVLKNSITDNNTQIMLSAPPGSIEMRGDKLYDTITGQEVVGMPKKVTMIDEDGNVITFEPGSDSAVQQSNTQAAARGDNVRYVGTNQEVTYDMRPTGGVSENICNKGTCKYTLLAPIGNLLGQKVGQKYIYTITQSNNGICSLFNTWFRVGIALAGLFAVVMIVLGGIEYATTDSLFNKSEGKSKVENAVFGLLLALTTWLIIYTINPALTRCDIAATPVTLDALQIQKNALVIAGASAATTNSINGLTLAGNAPGAGTLQVGSENTDALRAASEAYKLYGSAASNQRYIGVMDYSQSSSEPRLYIVDLQTGAYEVTKAAHGVGSDPNNTGYATQFSDIEGSRMSSLGSFIAQPYVSPSTGKDVLLLNGLEAGNKGAASRGLEIHTVSYADNSTEAKCGRTYGCIGIPADQQQNIISDKLKGAFIYNYAKQP